MFHVIAHSVFQLWKDVNKIAWEQSHIILHLLQESHSMSKTCYSTRIALEVHFDKYMLYYIIIIILLVMML